MRESGLAGGLRDGGGGRFTRGAEWRLKRTPLRWLRQKEAWNDECDQGSSVF